jgi:tol-pal system protein YbgF
MSRPSLRALLCLLPAATLVASCSAGLGRGGDPRYDDLRTLVLEQRRAIEDLRKEQESLRASIDQMEYGRRGAARPAYGPGAGPGGPDDSYWRHPTPPGTGETPPDYGSTVPGAPAVDPRFSSAPGSALPSGPPPSALAPGAASAPASPPATAPGAPAPTPLEGAREAVPAELVGTTYDSAMRQLTSGDHDEAIQSFRNYLHENASSAYADDAQFWIGEAYFRKGQYHRAIIEFNQVSINYGSGDRAPAALLRQAEAFRIVGDRVDARLSLQKVINRYPGTQEAAKASRMLNEIGG